MARSLILLAGALATAALGPSAHAARAQTAPALDSARLLRHLSVLAHDSMAGRRTGTPGAERAQTYIASELEKVGGLDTDADFMRPFGLRGRAGVNLVATVPGAADPDGNVIVVTAHYDHLGVLAGEIYNGADDNASGVAALLEIGRVLAGAPLDHTAVLAFFDAEEGGMFGSKAFVADPPVRLDRIALNVNLDMVARTDGLLWAGGAHHTPALRPVLEAVAAEAPLDLRLGHDRPGAPEGADWTDSSDHAAFHAVGIPFVYFGVEDHVDYHEPTDDAANVHPGEFAEAVRTVLISLRALDAALPIEETDAR